MTVTDVKKFLKIDGDDDNANLATLMDAAKAHVRAAAGNFDTYYGDDDDYTSIADMAIKLYILTLYDNPGAALDGTITDSSVLKSLLAQLQYWTEDASE